MLPLMLYEILPLAYFTIGAVLLKTGENSLVLISAMLFYCAGAIIWVMRSENRRTDHHTGPNHKKLFLPEALYELKPFIYVFLGIMLIRFDLHISLFVGGLLFIVWGFYCLFRRSSHRHHKLTRLSSHIVKF
jgi:hypothetical protein